LKWFKNNFFSAQI